MDQQLTYFRTPSGDDAKASRTRIVQRNLRNVLDLVDGRRTVGEIVKAFGDAAIAEAALADLERSGLIETEHGRSLRESVPTQPPATPAAPAAEKAKGRKPTLKSEAFDEDDITVMDPLDFAGAGIAGTGPGESPRKPAAPGSAPWQEDEDLAELASGRAPPPDYKVPSFGGDDEADFVAPRRASRFDLLSARARVLRAIKFVLAGIVAMAAIGGAIVLFFPYERYLPRVELRIRAAVGEPVRVDEMRVSFSPAPSVRFSGFDIGEGALKARTVTAFPRLSTLFADRKELRDVLLQQVEIDVANLGRLPPWIGGTGGTRPYFIAEGMRFSQLTLRLGDLILEGLGGDAVLDKQGRLLRLRFANAEGNFHGELEPQDKSYRIRLSADEWKVPFMETVVLSGFAAEGSLAGGGLRLDKFDARGFGGVVSGSMLLNWADGGELSGVLDLKRVSATSFLNQMRPGLRVQGDLSARLQVSGRAPALAQLRDRLAFSGPISMQRVVLSNMNFVDAVRSRSANPTRGGDTRFEKLTGDFRLDGDQWVLSGLAMSAGLMSGSGSVTLGTKEIAGLVHISFAGGNQLGAPVTIGGTPGDPQLSSRR